MPIVKSSYCSSNNIEQQDVILKLCNQRTNQCLAIVFQSKHKQSHQIEVTWNLKLGYLWRRRTQCAENPGGGTFRENLKTTGISGPLKLTSIKAKTFHWKVRDLLCSQLTTYLLERIFEEIFGRWQRQQIKGQDVRQRLRKRLVGLIRIQTNPCCYSKRRLFSMT